MRDGNGYGDGDGNGDGYGNGYGYGYGDGNGNGDGNGDGYGDRSHPHQELEGATVAIAGFNAREGLLGLADTVTLMLGKEWP